MQRIAVAPGSYDPVTLGHVDVLTRAAALVDELHVVVTHNPAKSALLPLPERVRLLREVLAGAPGVVVEHLAAGLLVDHCRAVGATVILKGLRTATDVQYETPMAIVNRDLAGIETLFLVADPAVGHISSSLVRQVAALGGDVSPYVPAVVADALRSRS